MFNFDVTQHINDSIYNIYDLQLYKAEYISKLLIVLINNTQLL